MPYEMKWLVKDAVMLERVYGDYSFEELKNASIEIASMLEAGNRAQVHLVIDASDLKSVPTNLRQIVTEASTTMKNPRMGWVVAYGTQNKLLNFIATMSMQAFKTKYRLYPTAEQALMQLQKLDPTLPPLQIDDLTVA